MQISPAAMIDKITSRLSSQKPRPQSLNEDDEDSDKDEVEMIDKILTSSRKHPLTELSPAPPGLSPVQVYVHCNVYLFIGWLGGVMVRTLDL